MSINVSPKYGGSGLDTLSTSIIVEELSNGCASTGIIVAIHNCLYANLLNSRGTEKQKDEFLRPFTNGDIGAFALSEHGLLQLAEICNGTLIKSDFFFLLKRLVQTLQTFPQQLAETANFSF